MGPCEKCHHSPCLCPHFLATWSAEDAAKQVAELQAGLNHLHEQSQKAAEQWQALYEEVLGQVNQMAPGLIHSIPKFRHRDLARALAARIPDVRTGVLCPAPDPRPRTSVSVFYPCGLQMNVFDCVIHLNDYHGMSREEIADWLETLDLDLTIPINSGPTRGPGTEGEAHGHDDGAGTGTSGAG